MPASVNVANTWRTIASLYVNVSGTWRTVTNGYVNVAGTWRTFFASAITPSIASTVTITRNNATYPSTLTGTNFRWTNSTSLTYVFQKSSDNSNFVDIGLPVSINNPSVGSSNTVTYVLTPSDFPAPISYYRFVVTAVNSTYSTSATSTSTSVSVSAVPSGGTVSISTNTGNYNVGSIITFSTTGWSFSPTSYSLRLYNGTNPVLTSDPLRASTSSTSGTYTIVSADVPNFFKAFATATNSAGTSTEVSSTQVGPAVAPVLVPVNTSIPTTSGNLSVGSIVTFGVGSWSNSPTGYDLRLYRGTAGVLMSETVVAFAGSAISDTYQITQADFNSGQLYLRSYASATNAGGTSAYAAGQEIGPITSATVPGLVTSFTATSLLSGSTLSWNATWSAPSSNGGSTITSYKVFVERAGSSTGPWIASTTSISTTSGGTYSGAFTAASPYTTVNATTPKTIYGRVTGTAATWIRVSVAAVNAVGTGAYNTAVG
jgi:hypothetical protein